jgi:hypothetical protein
VFAGVLGPIFLIIVFVIIINILQAYIPDRLPTGLRTWSWLPRPLRSLAWYDEHLFGKCCLRCKKKKNMLTTNGNIHNNESYTNDDQKF